MTTDIPHIFATPPRDNTVALYTATLLQESPGPYSESPPVFLVTPYHLFQPDDALAFCVPSPVRLADNQEILLVADQSTPAYRRHHRSPDNYATLWDPPTHHHHTPTGVTRDVFFQGRWRSTDRALASMYCATLIPILQFTDGSLRAPWPRPETIMPITRGSPEVLRAWEERWEPDTWNADIARQFTDEPEPTIPVLFPATGGGAARPTITSAPPTVSRAGPSLPVSRPEGTNSSSLPPSRLDSTGRPPSFVLEALIRDAISRHTTCPITMEPLTTPSKVAVTNCYHLFDATALATWRTSSGECPTCRAVL